MICHKKKSSYYSIKDLVYVFILVIKNAKHSTVF